MVLEFELIGVEYGNETKTLRIRNKKGYTEDIYLRDIETDDGLDSFDDNGNSWGWGGHTAECFLTEENEKKYLEKQKI